MCIRDRSKTIDYYYRLVKNNTNTSDKGLIVEALRSYGWQRVLYTLWYLKYEQRANITSFKYVDKVLCSQKDLDPDVVDFVAGRELRNLEQ